MNCATKAPQTPEQYLGAIHVIDRMMDWMLLAPVKRATPVDEPEQVVFRGRNSRDTKRAMLRYWSRNEARLGLELDEFQRRCSMNEDRSVSFRTPIPR